MIRVLVVDDHPIVRQGLVSSLEDAPDLQVVGVAASAEAAAAIAERERPDVILLDLELPGLDGISAIPRLASAERHVIVFTAYDTDERVLGALRAGAKGYILKGAPIDEITRGIRAVASGGSALTPRVAATLVTAIQTPPAPEILSAREMAVLQLVAAGRANKEIGRALGISERTARFHVSAILRKLGAATRAQAVALATQRGLL